MNDPTKKAAHELLADPLSSITRASKKSMLVFASLCCLVSYTGVVPEEASVLGFKFPGLTSCLIRWVLLVLLLYNYIAFLIHLVSDYFRHQILTDRYNYAEAVEIEEACTTPPDEEADYHENEFRYITGYKEKTISARFMKATNIAKRLLDFILPVLLGLLSLIYFLFKWP